MPCAVKENRRENERILSGAVEEMEHRQAAQKRVCPSERDRRLNAGGGHDRLTENKHIERMDVYEKIAGRNRYAE